MCTIFKTFRGSQNIDFGYWKTWKFLSRQKNGSWECLKYFWVEENERTDVPVFSEEERRDLFLLLFCFLPVFSAGDFEKEKRETCFFCCLRQAGPQQPGRRRRSWCRSTGSWKLSANKIIFQWNYLPMKLSANDADQQEVGNYLPISANVRSQGYHLNFGILENGPSFSCSI